MTGDEHPTMMVGRLEAATNAHDLDALVECFAPQYVNETPLHPSRGFSGREQVRDNWRTIFAGVPDVRAVVLRVASDGDLVWSEWEVSGHRRDGGRHLMRGVILFTVEDGLATRARFYLEPVDHDDTDASRAVRAIVGPRS
jgi:ketosteroid isomerase-like protein